MSGGASTGATHAGVQVAATGQASATGAGTAVAAPPDGVTENIGSRLVAWTESHGGRASGKVAFLQPGFGDDRQCVARLPIQEDELLVEMPRSLVFETAPANPLGVPSDLMALLRPLAQEEDGSCEGPVGRSLAVALLVHHERMRGDASEFAPYLDSLPLRFPTMPLLDIPPPWAAEAAQPDGSGGADGSSGSSASCSSVGVSQVAEDPWLYKGTGVEQLARAQAALAGPEGIDRMRELIESLDPDGLYWHHAQRGNDSALRWAAAAVQSRAHASRKGGTALVPLADCFNHSPSAPNAELREGETTFQVRTLRHVSVGEELTLSYGAYSNAELLFNAGFACPTNPSDCVLVSRRDLLDAAQRRWRVRGLGVPEGLDTRCKQLSVGIPPPKLCATAPLLGGAVPASVVTLLVGLLLDAETWQKHADGAPGSIQKLWAVGCSPAAEFLRDEVLHTLVELLEETLKSRYLALAAGDDVAALAAAERMQTMQNASISLEVPLQRRVNILRVRVGERHVLARLIEVLRMRLRATRPAAASNGQVETEVPPDAPARPLKRPRSDD